jgi:hypothetical protein
MHRTPASVALRESLMSPTRYLRSPNGYRELSIGVAAKGSYVVSYEFGQTDSQVALESKAPFATIRCHELQDSDVVSVYSESLTNIQASMRHPVEEQSLHVGLALAGPASMNPQGAVGRDHVNVHSRLRVLLVVVVVVVVIVEEDSGGPASCSAFNDLAGFRIRRDEPLAPLGRSPLPEALRTHTVRYTPDGTHFGKFGPAPLCHLRDT